MGVYVSEVVMMMHEGGNDEEFAAKEGLTHRAPPLAGTGGRAFLYNPETVALLGRTAADSDDDVGDDEIMSVLHPVWYVVVIVLATAAVSFTAIGQRLHDWTVSPGAWVVWLNVISTGFTGVSTFYLTALSRIHARSLHWRRDAQMICTSNLIYWFMLSTLAWWCYLYEGDDANPVTAITGHQDLLLSMAQMGIVFKTPLEALVIAKNAKWQTHACSAP